MFCFGRFDNSYVGFDEIGFDSGVEELQSIDHSRVFGPVHALLLGSTAYNCQSTNATATTTTTINDERVRFETRVERRGIFVERVEF